MDSCEFTLHSIEDQGEDDGQDDVDQATLESGVDFAHRVSVVAEPLLAEAATLLGLVLLDLLVRRPLVDVQLRCPTLVPGSPEPSDKPPGTDSSVSLRGLDVVPPEEVHQFPRVQLVFIPEVEGSLGPEPVRPPIRRDLR